MSLAVWLPLNGSLAQQGLKQYTLSMHRGSEVYHDSGKIGKAFYANGVNTIQIQNIIPDFYDYSAYSICAWFYIEARNTVHNGSAIISAGNWNQQVINLAVSDYSNGVYTNLRVSGTSWSKIYAYTFELNKWYHVVVGSNSTSTFAYVNGTLIGTSQPSFLPTSIEGNNIDIGGATYYGGMQFFGRINDVRIYDHALSAKEVKEIAKGLILHYKLDDPYVEGTTNLCQSLVAGGRTTVTNGTVSNTGANQDTYWYIKPKEALVGGATYTVSCYLTGFTLDTTYIGWGVGAQSGTKCAGYWYTRNGYNTFTFTMPTELDGSTANFIFDDNGGTRTEIFTISRVQLEKKDHVTPYAPYDTTRTPTTVYDHSGYKYNGTILNTLSANTSSPRYSVSTKFPTNTSKVQCPAIKCSNFGNSFTFSWWQYLTTVSSVMPWGFGDGNRVNPYHSGTLLWNTGDGSANPFKDGSTTINPTELKDGWHHLAITGDGTENRVYIDGVYRGKATTYKALTGTTIYLSGWASASTYSIMNGSLSDFRLYATVLSADDILELYHTSGVIDKAGNVYAREVIET